MALLKPYQAGVPPAKLHDLRSVVPESEVFFRSE